MSLQSGLHGFKSHPPLHVNDKGMLMHKVQKSKYFSTRFLQTRKPQVQRIIMFRNIAEEVGKNKAKEMLETSKLQKLLDMKSSGTTGKISSHKLTQPKARLLMGIGVRELQPAIVDAIKEIKNTNGKVSSRTTKSMPVALSLLEAADIIETRRRHKSGGPLIVKIKDKERLNKTLTPQKDGYYRIAWDVKLKD